MSGRLVARRYAKALVEIGVKQGNLSDLQKELSAVSALVRSHPDVERLAVYPLLAPAKRAEAFDAVLGLTGASGLVRQFFRVVAQSARLYLIQEIIEAFSELVDKRMGILEARVTSAQPLSGIQAETLVASLGRRTGKTIRLQWKQDSALLGGLKVQVESTVYDASLQGRLSILKAQLLSA